jgi:predicted nucleic acid-binding protein
VIYAVEKVEPYAGRLDARLSAVDVELVASDLTRMECRVKPIKDADAVLLSEFDEFFEAAVSEIVPLSREVIDLATEIRAMSGFRTPDAIHVAAARVAACDVFLTNDHRLDRSVGISIEVVGQ